MQQTWVEKPTHKLFCNYTYVSAILVLFSFRSILQSQISNEKEKFLIYYELMLRKGARDLVISLFPG